MSWPAYLDSYRDGRLHRKIEEGLKVLESCTVCPRNCEINRLQNETKLCRVGRRARVSSAFPHFGEEDVLRGWNGSGTIFFSWCNLKCVFCQNWEVSNEGAGEEVDSQRLAGMMLELQGRGCHNINFVTPEHVVPQILEALPHAIEGGLRVPIIYNTSAYDSIHSLKLMEGIVDIYMPDFKYWDSGSSARLLKAKDYPQVTRAAIREMHRQVGDLQTDSNGLATRGLLIRHLVMPDSIEDSRKILGWLHSEFGRLTHINIMDQYYPAGRVKREPLKFSDLCRRTYRGEHRKVLEIASQLGLENIDRRRPHPRLVRRLLRQRLGI